jgi:hypothetical protein
MPQVGHFVNVTNGIDHQGEPETPRATPLTSWEFGEPKTRLYVIVEKHPTTPGVYRVVDTARLKSMAVERVQELDQAREMVSRSGFLGIVA